MSSLTHFSMAMARVQAGAARRHVAMTNFGDRHEAA